jgi:hypothetical protein
MELSPKVGRMCAMNLYLHGIGGDKEHRQTRESLQYARCKIEALEAKLQRMEQKAQELLAEATQDVTDDTGERFMRPFRRSA